MTFNFPGSKPTEKTASSTKHFYRVELNEPNDARVECDYVQFTPTHVTFWEENEPWDRLIVAVPLSANGYVRKEDVDDL